MKVLHDRILILRDAPKETTESGVYLPSSQIKPSDTGTIAEKGNKVSLNIGDRVMFAPDAGLPLEIEGKTYLIMKEHQILLTIHQSKD